MARISIGNLAVAGSRALGGLARGRLAGTQYRVQQEDKARQRQMEELRLSLAESAAARGASQDAALTGFLGQQPEGQDLPAGLSPSAKLGIYSSRLATRRSQTPGPTEARTRARQAQTDLMAQAQAVADYQASQPANWKPHSLTIYLAGRFPKINYDLLSGVATRALQSAARTKAASTPVDVNELLKRLPPEP